ncbi:MAG TPA: alpha/beta hydrolase-fold protein, partial [Planctomycetota bacterium]|nr:alpha/beta hydrolase-fold protein [Planctomycetota bacterium]
SVEFAPTSEGAHTAWLVAGPFAKALAEPGKGPVAREGEDLSGQPWKLVAWPTPAVELPAGPGLHYAAGALVSAEGGRRELRLRSTGQVRVWLNGRLLGATERDVSWGLHSARFGVELLRGTNRLLLEVAAPERGGGGEPPRAGFILAVAEASVPDGPLAAAERTAPERLALELSDAGPVRQAALLAGALTLVAGDSWLPDRGPAELRLERTGSAPARAAELELRLLVRPDAADRPGLKPAVRRLSAAELLAGASVPVQVPEGGFMALECAAELFETSGGRRLSRSICLLYSRPGIEDAGRKLLGDVLAARAAPERAGGAAGLALAQLKAEKAGLILSGRVLTEGAAGAVLEELTAGREALAAAAAGRDPLDGQVGWLERAYWCVADGSAQPYRLYVPRKLADPAERQGGSCPMIVYLHGYVPTYDKHRWVEEDQMRDICALAEREGAILLMPFGRSNTDFTSIGEVDVLRAIDEACRRYPVDRDRVSICGYSMGGYGAYNLAAHYPDRFSALAVLSGRPVPYYVEVRGRRGLPRYKGFCLDVDCPLLLAPNLVGMPVRIFHNRGEFIPFESAQAMAAQLGAAGTDVRLAELKGDHWSGWSALASPETVGWLASQVRPKRPDKVVIRTYSPRYGRSYWAQIDQLDRWTAPAELIAAETGKGQVELSARNVRAFTLRGICQAPGTGEIQPAVRGAEGFDLEFANRAGQGWEVRGRLKRAPAPGRWAKNAALPGPMKEACNGPFTVVWGSSGSAEEAAANEAKARRFAAEWQAFAKGAPQAVDEATLTDEEKTARSLIVFGSPTTSRLVAEAARLGALECRLSATELEIAGRKVSLEGDRGVVLTRPSPWCPAKDRYLVISAGRYYGDDADHPAANHKLDLIPDFIVFGAGAEGEGEPPALLAGYFDSDWKADPNLVEAFDAKPPAPAGGGN